MIFLIIFSEDKLQIILSNAIHKYLTDEHLLSNIIWHILLIPIILNYSWRHVISLYFVVHIKSFSVHFTNNYEFINNQNNDLKDINR